LRETWFIATGCGDDQLGGIRRAVRFSGLEAAHHPLTEPAAGIPEERHPAGWRFFREVDADAIERLMHIVFGIVPL